MDRIYIVLWDSKYQKNCEDVEYVLYNSKEEAQDCYDYLKREMGFGSLNWVKMERISLTRSVYDKFEVNDVDF